MISYFRGSFKIKLFAIVKDSRSFDVFDVFLTSAYFFCQIAKFFIGQFAYHTRDKQIELPLRGRPILSFTDQIGLHSVLLPLLIMHTNNQV